MTPQCRTAVPAIVFAGRIDGGCRSTVSKINVECIPYSIAMWESMMTKLPDRDAASSGYVAMRGDTAVDSRRVCDDFCAKSSELSDGEAST